MKTKSIKKAMISIISALILVMSTPVMALANDTDIIIIIPEDDAITMTIPTSVNLKMRSDGSVTGNTLQLKNGSVYPISVKSVSFTDYNNWTIVDNVATGSGTNLIDVTFTPSCGTNSGSTFITKRTGTPFSVYSLLSGPRDMTSDSAFHMGYAGSDSDIVSVSSVGHVANVARTSGSSMSLGKLTWVISAD